MAFMMPVMKNNYGPLYAAGAKPQRRISDTTDGKRSKAQAIPGKQRKVRSEGPSLSTSPGSAVTISGHPHGSLQVPNARGIGTRPIPVMGRVRGSAPVLGAAALPLHRHNSMPHAPQSVPNKPGSPTRSESSSSSSSEPASPSVTGRFHLKLIARLRRSLRLKDPTAPSSPSASPQPAATTA
ncbi:unnamed protein product [Orchesella dallaii]|uniref:Uncharacterized protein n=1 Tax=Orchesella dallaii TaxID=48710 RepID=A0ABP1QVJ6_9HEXA